MADIKIPPAALEAGMNCMPIMSEEEARAAFLAMIEAWEGMRHDGPSGGGISQEPLQLSRIILPLTENPDAEA